MSLQTRLKQSELLNKIMNIDINIRYPGEDSTQLRGYGYYVYLM